MNNVFLIVVSVLLALLLTISHVLFKVTANTFVEGQTLKAFYGNNIGKLLASLTLYFFVFVAYPYILRFFELSSFFPIYTSFTLLFVTIAGFLVFKEAPETRQIAGCVLLLIAVILITPSD